MDVMTSCSNKMSHSLGITACSNVPASRPVQPSMSALMAQDVSCYRHHPPARSQIMFKAGCSSPSQFVMAYLHGWPSDLQIPAGSGSQLMTPSMRVAWYIRLTGLLIVLSAVCFAAASTFLAGGEMMQKDSALSTHLLTQWSSVFLMDNSSRSPDQPTTHGLSIQLGMKYRTKVEKFIVSGLDIAGLDCTSLLNYTCTFNWNEIDTYMKSIIVI